MSDIAEVFQKLEKATEEWPKEVGKQVLQECETADHLKKFLKKKDRFVFRKRKDGVEELLEKPDLFVFGRRKNGTDEFEFWIKKKEADLAVLSDAAFSRALEALTPINVYNKVINVKEELEKELGDLSLAKGMDRTTSTKSQLVHFFEDRYVKGATFEVNDAEADSEKCQYSVSRHEHNDMTRVLCHAKTKIDVWADAVDLRSSCETCDLKSTDGCKCFKVLFHYTKKLAFSSITSAHKKFHELWCSYEKRAHFGDGLYASQYAPEHFGSKLRVALNNYGSCDTDPFDEEPLCCPQYWEDIRTQWAVEAADFCIPILVPADKKLLRSFKVEDPSGNPKAGCNKEGVAQHENRDVWIISPPDKGNVTSDTQQRLKLLKMRQDAEKNPNVSPLDRMQAFADAAHILLQQGDLAKAEKCFKDALDMQNTIKQTTFGPSLVQSYAQCLRQQDTYESKQKAKELFKEHKEFLEKHGVTNDADSGSMLKSLDHASWRHKALDKHFKCFYDSWKQGDLAVAQNRLDEFESLLERLPLKEKDRDRNTLKTYRAAVFSDQGNMQKAESLLKEVLDYRKKAFDPKHIETLACHDLLAKLFLNWRRFEDAEKHAQEALKGRDPDAEKHAQEALEGKGPDNKSEHLHVLRSLSFLEEIRIEKAQSEESSLSEEVSEEVFKKAFRIMRYCAEKMLPKGQIEAELANTGYEDNRAALAMWNNAACVARRLAALPKINEKTKEEMLQEADTIYQLLYKASKKPGRWDHAVHHARIASNWALVLDLRKSTEDSEKVLEQAIDTIEGTITSLKGSDSQSDDSEDSEEPYMDDHLQDQTPSEADPPLEFLILYNNLAFLRNKRGDLILKNQSGTVQDSVDLFKKAKEGYTTTLEQLKAKADRHATHQDNDREAGMGHQQVYKAPHAALQGRATSTVEASHMLGLPIAVQQEAYSAAMTLAEILLKLMDQRECSDDEREKFQKDASENFLFAAEGFQMLLGPKSVKAVACRHSYASALLQQGAAYWQKAVTNFESVARSREETEEARKNDEAVVGSWEEVSMGGAAAAMLQESLGLTEEVPPELLQKLMRARALFSAASASKAISMAPDPPRENEDAPTPDEICKKFDKVLEMDKGLGKDAKQPPEVLKRLRGIFAMAHAELGQLHGREYQNTKTLAKFYTAQEHLKEALKEWLHETPAEEEVQLMRCRTYFNHACLQLTALQYADVSTWEKVSDNFSRAADGYGELIKSGNGCRCKGNKVECFYYQRAMCKFNLIKAISMQREWQAVKEEQEKFEVLIREKDQKVCAGAPDADDVKKWKAELAKNVRRTSLVKEKKPSQVSPALEQGSP